MLIVDEVLRGYIEVLVKACQDILEELPKPCTEYQVIQALVEGEYFEFLGEASSTMLLFYKHFLTMHCLYRLQKSYADNGFFLQVSPLSIRLEAASMASQKLQPSLFHSSLSDYYLDLNQLTHASEESVLDLLSSFWRKFEAKSTIGQAYQTLGVSPSDSWEYVQRECRKQLARAHPDKGGNTQDFAVLKSAFDVVRKHHENLD